jgi:hypothetical protein
MAGTCLNPGPSFTGYAVVTIISDIVVAIIPIPVLLRLNVSRSKKVGLIGIFLLGLFTTLCSIMRYLAIDQIQNGDGNSTMLVLWGVIEFNVGVSELILSHLHNTMAIRPQIWGDLGCFFHAEIYPHMTSSSPSPP